MIKTLAGTSWGEDQETLVIKHKSVCRSVLEYASPIWSPTISPTIWYKLQKVQNSAFRFATACYLKAKPAHLHQETKVLPLQDHCKLIAQQYLAACFLPGHPCRKHLDRPPNPRPERGETNLTYKPIVQPYYEGIEPSDLVYKENLKSLHTEAENQTILSYPPNRVPPPPINPEVLKLKRTTRSTLSQLRSGFSNKLNSYMNILDPANPNKCSDCLATPHNTTHLLECTQNPIELTTSSLLTDRSWQRNL